MNLKSRIGKLQKQSAVISKPDLTPEEEAIRTARKDFFAFIYSEPFIKEFCDKVNALFTTMEDEHAKIVIADCRTLEQWDQGFPYPQENRITEYFFRMLKTSLEGSYVGPLALPATVCEFWREYSNGQCGVYIGGVDCEDCGYVVPSNSWFGYKRHFHDRSSPEDYEAMRCPLCSGKASPDAYSKKHPDKHPGHYNHRELDKLRLTKFPQSFDRILQGCHTYGLLEPMPLKILLARLLPQDEQVM